MPIGKSPAAALRAGRGGLDGGCTPVAPAWGAEVVSSNIVGYNKVTLTSGYNMLGFQFLNIGQDEQDINEVINGDTDLPGLDAEGNTTYGLMDKNDGTENEMPAWDSKWVLKDFSDLATGDCAVGDGFWIQTTAAAEITFSGEVPEEDTKEVQVASGYNLLSNPFPEALPIQSVQSNDLPGLDAEGNFQSFIKVWNGSGYTTYGWMDANDGTENEMPAWNSKWVLKDFSDLASTTISIGAGFWVQTSAAATITFTK